MQFRTSSKPYQHKIIIPLLLMLLWLVPAAASAEEYTIRVLVMDGLESITLTIPAEYNVSNDSENDVVSSDTRGTTIKLDSRRGDAGVRINAWSSIININNFALTGIIDIQKNKKGLYSIINELGLEDYTRAVVGEEMGANWPLEALKAQAVVARTYALYKKRSEPFDGYDLCATVNSQVFLGDAKEKSGPAEAARQTEGEVLMYQGGLIETLYHSCCGGQTEDARDVWGRDYPYFKPQDCICSDNTPLARWEKTFDSDDIERLVTKSGLDIDGLKYIKVGERTATGRVRLLKLVTKYGTKTIKGLDFRKAVGYTKLPSTSFEVRKEGGSFVFTGKGSGHGVGLCQWGARKMAEDGSNYLEILTHYYPGAKITKLGAE